MAQKPGQPGTGAGGAPRQVPASPLVAPRTQRIVSPVPGEAAEGETATAAAGAAWVLPSLELLSRSHTPHRERPVARQGEGAWSKVRTLGLRGC